ncbi:hypothetical protein SLS58_003184 [Diplodia intermedia]|uniref:BTB domain-containing protein n=1 Tax=Diplodia intermedia TaxID=856260 RepID=A0ABR3TXS5_9PEZI
MANCKSKKPPFINQVAGHFANNELYSDVTLRFAGNELPAHRVVLASQSGWFAQQLLEAESQLKKDDDASSSSASPPATTLTLDLTNDHDHPDLLSALITYMYTRVYPNLIATTTNPADDATDNNPTPEPEPAALTCLRHLRLYVLATSYGVPSAAAAAARRVKDYMDELYAVQADLLTDFVPFLFGDALAPVPLTRDEHGLRAFVAGRAAADRLERVRACEVERYVREYPLFAVEYLTACWNKRAMQIEEGSLQSVFCPGCDYSMEIALTGKEYVARKNSGISFLRSESDGLDKPDDSSKGDPIRTCPNCQGPLEKQPIN